MNFFVQKEKCEWPQQRRVNRTLPLFVCLLELLWKVYFFLLGKVIHFTELITLGEPIQL